VRRDEKKKKRAETWNEDVRIATFHETNREEPTSGAVNERQTMRTQRTTWKPVRENEADKARAATNTRWTTHVETEERNGGVVQLPENRSPAVDARIESHEGAGSSQRESPELTAEEQEFITTLNDELNKFNNFFMEKEEEHVINLRNYEDRAHRLLSKEEAEVERLQCLVQELTQLHGDMVMLLNWSMLNYAALVKILKKHDKMTGLLIRSEYLANVVKQPFFSTGLMKKLVKKAEGLIRTLSLKDNKTSELLPGELPELVAFSVSTDPDAQLSHIQQAIEVWKQLRPTAPQPPGIPPPEKRVRLE